MSVLKIEMPHAEAALTAAELRVVERARREAASAGWAARLKRWGKNPPLYFFWWCW